MQNDKKAGERIKKCSKIGEQFTYKNREANANSPERKE